MKPLGSFPGMTDFATTPAKKPITTAHRMLIEPPRYVRMRVLVMFNHIPLSDARTWLGVKSKVGEDLRHDL